jgi:long-chain acyl-CoA synthetase
VYKFLFCRFRFNKKGWKEQQAKKLLKVSILVQILILIYLVRFVTWKERKMPKPPGIYGVPVPGSESPDSTPIYRHPACLNGLHDKIEDKSLTTLWDLITHTVKKYPNSKCHGVREIGSDGKAGEFKWLTYQQVFERVTHFASGLKPYMEQDATNTMKLVGLMGLNSPYWTWAEWACLGNGGTTVPLYTTTPKETLEYTLNHNGCAVVVADVPCAKSLIKAKSGIPNFKTLVVYGKGDISEIKKEAEATGLKFFTFEEVEEAGKNKKLDFDPPSPATVFSFIYTSGSTGMPKGALLTHEANMSVMAGVLFVTKYAQIPLHDGKEFHLSYLPSAHVMERTIQSMLVLIGGAIGFYQGKREELLDDLKTLRPTVFPSVPRLLNLIYDKIMNKVRSTGGIKEKLFMKGLNAKIARLKKGTLTHPLWDALVFGKLKKSLGFDRCKFILTGSAPIAGTVLDFYRAAFGTVVIEGYGATETCAQGTLTHPWHFSSEHVGGPGPNCELKLVSIPHMDYLVTDTKHNNGMQVKGRGEICVRAKCLMREYYRNPEATQKAIDKDGFYHTGDVGCILTNGTFKIFDRVGNVFKLSIGEYVVSCKSRIESGRHTRTDIILFYHLGT